MTVADTFECAVSIQHCGTLDYNHIVKQCELNRIYCYFVLITVSLILYVGEKNLEIIFK
jgi:hypothetical protein